MASPHHQNTLIPKESLKIECSLKLFEFKPEHYQQSDYESIVVFLF